jgi:hypothetical protein
MVKMNSESPNFPNFISLFNKQEPAFDLYFHLLTKRINFLRGELIEETINRILAANTGRSPELIEQDIQRDFFLSAKEAKAYGLIDEIVSKPPV